MLLAVIFAVLLIAVMAVWIGKRKMAISVFILAMVMALTTFIHHMTDIIGLSL